MLLPSSPCSTSPPPGADGERFGIGPGNVPEGDDGGVGPALANEARQQREVIVLHQHHRIVAVGLADDRVGEARVHQPVVVPIGFAKGRTHIRVVAQRPQALVGEARVVAGFLLAREPDAADAVGRMVGRHVDMVIAIDGLAVRRSAAMGDPGSRTGAHDRLQRRDKTACRVLDADAFRRAHVDVRFPVRNHDDVIAAQFTAQRGPKRLLRPALLALVEGPIDALEVAQQRAHVALDRLQFRRRRPGRRPQDPFTMKQRAQTRHPSAPRQLSDDYGDQGDAGAQGQEEIEEVTARFLGAAGEEGQVVDENHRRCRGGLRRDRPDHHEQQAIRCGDRALPVLEGRQVGALDFRGERLRRNHGGIALLCTDQPRRGVRRR